MTFRTALVLFALLIAAARAEIALRYDKPAQKWSAEALPLGNGRLGCMVFGGIDRERIQFNEDSLWTGDLNPSGNYDTMGAYQNFGDLFIDFGRDGETKRPRDEVGVSSPSEQKAFYASEEVDRSVDGDPKTKWCLEHKGKPVIWQIKLAKAQAIKSYAFTACGDLPTRDPKTWEVAGSNDGKTWTTLDKRENEKPIDKRGGTRAYTFKNETAYLYYRITFLSNQGAPHLQLAEVAMGEQNAAATQHSAPSTQNYSRSLSLSDAIARTVFVREGVTHTREVLASHPEQVIALRWSADKPGSITGTLRLAGAHQEKTQAEGGALSFNGKLPNGLEYEARLRVINKGGKAIADGDALQLEKCDEVVILLAAGTDYIMDYAKKWKGEHPARRLTAQLDAAAKLSWEQLKSRHIADHQALFNRVTVAWGRSSPDQAKLPTDQRLAAYGKAAPDSNYSDPDLEQTLFQYGRYLLIASSRRPGLPANLQGLWNDSNKPAWASDYHTNINIQMNYWPAEPANLSECHLPLFDLISAMQEPSRIATRAAFGNVRGWTARTSHNIFGGHGWQWNIPASAWYAQHYFEHWSFTQDRAFLREVAYPVLKEVCQFWEDHLKRLPDGRLVVPNGWSPEHGPREDGVAHDQQIVWDLFTNFIEASEALGVDADYRKKIGEMREKLVGPKIGRWGQLQEWMADRDDPKDQHRHTSHLFAVYPGRQISVARTPEWAKAAAISLEARGTGGDSRREWAWAWRSAMWARLRQPERAHAMLRNLVAHNTLPNLLGNHPPMQMDGNWGITAGICEMLVQSHAGEIHLLPALPKAWSEGSFTGLRARGGFTVSATWKEGKVVDFKITSKEPRKVRVVVNGEMKEMTSDVP